MTGIPSRAGPPPEFPEIGVYADGEPVIWMIDLNGNPPPRRGWEHRQSPMLMQYLSDPVEAAKMVYAAQAIAKMRKRRRRWQWARTLWRRVSFWKGAAR